MSPKTESDLARPAPWRGMTGEGFWDAYRAHHAAAPGYRERRPVLPPPWRLEYAAPTAVHRADTAAVCRELGIPPIDC